MSKLNVIFHAGILSALFLGLALFTACGEHEGHDEADHQAEEAADDGHSHGAGPHGGPMLVVGDHAGHVEWVLDREAGKLDLYILGADAKTPVTIAEAPKINLMLAEGNQQLVTTAVDEKEGAASHFEITNEILKGEHLHGRIALTFEGKPYSVETPSDHEHEGEGEAETSDAEDDSEHEHEEGDEHE